MRNLRKFSPAKETHYTVCACVYVGMCACEYVGMCVCVYVYKGRRGHSSLPAVVIALGFDAGLVGVSAVLISAADDAEAALCKQRTYHTNIDEPHP